MSEYSHLQIDFLRQEHVRFLKQLSEKEFWDYAVACAHAHPLNCEPADAYLVCDLSPLGGILSLIDLRAVVPSPTHFSLLPHAPGWLMGLAAWSGMLLPVIDLKTYLLQNSYTPTNPHGMLLIAQYEDLSLGLVAPVVGMIANLDAVPMQTPEQVQTSFIPPCPGAVRGISVHTEEVVGMREMEMALLLDLPIILADIVKCTRTMAAYG